MTKSAPVISVDVEDWLQSTWDHNLPITRRAADNTLRLLEILDGCGTKVTTFVLGKFCEAFPHIVREIDKAGHEVASHGYGHIQLFNQSPSEFAEDVKRSKDLLEQTIGKPVRGYRAPDFSVTYKTLWALEVLTECGFEYDSSIFPIRHPRYGIDDWPSQPVRVILPDRGSIVEFPIGTFRLFGRNWPIGGGGYHRLLPGSVARWLVRRVLGRGPFVFYCHPYEFDPKEFAEISIRVPRKTSIHQGLGRRWFKARFHAFVREFGGQRMMDLLDSRKWPDWNCIDRLNKFDRAG